MADFEDALNSLLANPDAMGQIMSLAGKLGGKQESPPDEEWSGAAASEQTPLFGVDQLGQMGKLLELFKSGNQMDPQTVALLTALRPFLREERQQKLDKALRYAGLSHVAQEAYRLWKEGELHL